MTSFIDALKAYNEKLSKMPVQDQIKFEMKASMKNGNTKHRDLMRVVMGEFATVNKTSREVTDEQALKVIKKMHSNAIEMENKYEIAVLERWIPKMLTEEELREEVEALILENNLYSMEKFGQTMGLLQKHPKKAQIDMKLASQFAKEILLQEE